MSPERSPKHKHSKRHKKEHSHKKSKRSRHEDDVSAGAAPGDVADDVVTTDGAVTNDAQEAVEDVVAAADDLETLRQAALQTTKAAVNTETNTEMAEAAIDNA